MKAKILLSFFLITSTFAQFNFNIELMDEIEEKIRIKYGNDINLLNYFEMDSLSIKNAHYALAHKIFDPYNTLDGFTIFCAIKSDTSISRKGLIGLFKNGNIVWDSDTSIICYDVDMLYLFSVNDLNNDGKVELSFTGEEWGTQVGTERLYIYSWSGSNGQLISNLNEAGVSEIATLTNRGDFEFIDSDGDGIYEIRGLWYLSDEDIEDKLVTYYWDGIKYYFNSNSYQPQSTDFLPRDRVEVIVTADVQKPDSNYIFNYSLSNSSFSIQEINAIYFEQKTDSLTIIGLRDGWEFNNFFNLLAFEDYSITNDQFPTTYIKRNETDNSCIVSSYSLPSIARFYIQGYNKIPLDTNITFENIYTDILTNSYSGYTIGPADIIDPFISSDFIDTLLNYNQRSLELGWITNQTTADKYDTLFTTAKTLLDGNHIPWVENTLQTVLEEVDQDSSDNITSEAYALLRYNTEYLLENLPEVIPPVLNSISPAIALPFDGIFEEGIAAVVKVKFFSQSSVVYYNGEEKEIEDISDSSISFRLYPHDMSEPGDYPVWIDDNGSLSDTLFLSVVETLPESITPILECVEINGSIYTAYFGYNNNNNESVFIPIGGKNSFLQDMVELPDIGQPTMFLPGVQTNVFDFNYGNFLMWILDDASATADQNSEPCE